MTTRHVLVVVAGLLICFAPCAMVYNCWSIFVVPVSSELGVASSQFTFFITLIYLIGALAAPFAGNLLERFDARVVLSASVVLVALGMFCCSFWQEVWQFYLSGIAEGLGMVILMFLAVPTLINRWFAKRTGFFIGLCFAMSGVGGAVWSMVGGILIANASWHMAYAVFALLLCVLTLPATLFFIRSYPEEVHLVAYGADTNTVNESFQAQGSVLAHTMFRSPVFYLLMFTMGVFNALTVVVNLYASYIYHLGDLGVLGSDPQAAVAIASAVAAILMAVAALAKILLGALTDKNMKVALCLACGCGFMSIVCMWFASSTTLLIYAGALLGGFLYAAIDALSPSITRQITGPRDYTIIYSRITIFVNLAGAFAATAFAAVSEISWEAEWVLGLLLIVITLITGMIALKLSKNLPREE